ncbi:MAG: hypothetical protein V3W04_13685 [Gammaproteobacteria bacterium]
MRYIQSLLATGMLIVSGAPFAGGPVLSEKDCTELLDRWAADPASVPAHLVDHCRNLLAAGGVNPAGAAVPLIEPAAGGNGSDPSKKALSDENDLPALSSTEDPCASPGSASSVHCWGSWSSLAPAAGAVVASLPFADNLKGLPRPEDRPNVAAATTDTDSLPLGSCQAGQSCGFATVFDGSTARPGEADATQVVRFHLEQDGSQFVVDPGGENEIISNDDMVVSYVVDRNGQELMLSEVQQGITESKLLRVRVYRDEDGNILKSGDIWKHSDIISDGETTFVDGHSGEYAWGIATSQNTLDRLNSGQGISVSFSGAMAIDQTTTVNMTVDFGSQPIWTSEWVNPGYRFGAGGSVNGVDLVSDPALFTDNVQENSYVQGVVLGEENDQAIAHAVDVTLDESGLLTNVKDVGLLHENSVSGR